MYTNTHIYTINISFPDVRHHNEKEIPGDHINHVTLSSIERLFNSKMDEMKIIIEQKFKEMETNLNAKLEQMKT